MNMDSGIVDQRHNNINLTDTQRLFSVYLILSYRFERILHSILASRAILHIRKAASEDSIHSGGMDDPGVGSERSGYIEMLFAENGVMRTRNEPEVPIEHNRG
ncbi:hypothetical protein PM082_022807 [Marasmius tenuissimus]|nr:hypothetical protein PM082_022807 [Marasmius tenuissimus]